MHQEAAQDTTLSLTFLTSLACVSTIPCSSYTRLQEFLVAVQFQPCSIWNECKNCAIAETHTKKLHQEAAQKAAFHTILISQGMADTVAGICGCQEVAPKTGAIIIDILTGDLHLS